MVVRTSSLQELFYHILCEFYYVTLFLRLFVIFILMKQSYNL